MLEMDSSSVPLVQSIKPCIINSPTMLTVFLAVVKLSPPFKFAADSLVWGKIGWYVATVSVTL